MKSHRIIATLTLGALACAGLPLSHAQSTQPVVVSPPAVQDGSNWSRAPFPAKRQFDDVKGPDGRAIDRTVPPNTPATNLEPAVPVSTVTTTTYVTPAPVTTVVATPVDPVLTPTGRPTEMATPAASSSERIVPPAVKDGSNWSRAPFPSRRQFDDVKGPDGQAVDPNLPPAAAR